MSPMNFVRTIAAFVFALAFVCQPALASAFVAASPESRVGAFEDVQAAFTGGLGDPSHGLHKGIGAAYDEIASGYRFAARGIPNVHMGKQGKHIVGHPNYTPGRSVLRADPAALAKRAGTGSPVNKVPRGQAGFKERVQFDDVIGDFVKDGVATPTRNGIITYAKDGSIHIIQAAP